MRLTQEHYDRIAHCFPKPRGSLTYSNLEVLNAILYIAENGAKWRRLPREFGHWHTVYARMGPTGRAGPCLRSHAGLADRPNQGRSLLAGQHFGQSPSRRHRRAKKNGPQSIGRSRGGLTTKIHLVAANERTALCFSLSPGQAADGPEGRKLLEGWKQARPEGVKAVVMDRAYEGDQTRQLVLDLNLEAVVPPKINRLNPWEYDREIYKRRNEVERLFRRLKAFRRIFSRFEKLDAMFTAFIQFALIADGLVYINTP